jgi:hypothetical protein
MKLQNVNLETGAYDSRDVYEETQNYGVKDRLDREIGANCSISAEKFVECPTDWRGAYWSPDNVLTGPGEYFFAFTRNLRDGNRYQASTRKLFKTLAEARAYTDAFLARKAKEAPSKAGK